jgi:hypothetical protein
VVSSDTNNIESVTNAEVNGTVVQNWAYDIQYADATGLDSSTRYYFNVLVKDEAGNVGAYAMNGFYTADDDSPVPGDSGTLSFGSITASSIGISWTKGSDPNFITPEGDLEYRVVRSDAANIDTLSNAEANGTVVQDWTRDIASATATGLPDSRKYYFNVIIRDLAGNKAAYSMGSAVTLDTTLPVPGNGGTITTSGVTDTSVTLNWTKGTDNLSAQGALQYKVVRSDSNNINTVANAEANGTVVQDWTADINTKEVTGLTMSTTYYFNVLVKDEAGNKAVYVMKCKATTPDIIAPTPGNGGAISSGEDRGTSFYISWDSAADAGSDQSVLQYKVVKSNTANIDTVTNAEANGTVVQIWTPCISFRELVKLNTSTTYYYNVIVKDEAGNKSAYTMGTRTTRDKATLDQTNESVKCMVNDGTTLYIGGVFTRISVGVGNGAIIDTTSGDLPSGAVSSEITGNPAGPVNICIPDGNGGWFIGGNFPSVRGFTRYNIAHLYADGTLYSWRPNVNGSVLALAVSGNTLYIGGDFTTVSGLTRNRLAAFDMTTGAIKSWDPNVDNTVCSISVNGGMLYVGGTFTAIGGQSRNRIAAIDVNTGVVTSWNPDANSDVRTLVVSGSTVYAGGYFTTVGAQTRNYIAALDMTTGTATTWNPNANSTVSAISLSGSTVYAGGVFSTIGGQTRNKIAALDMTTGNATSWNPNPYGDVLSIAVNGSTLYVAGYICTIGGQTRNRIAAIDMSTNTATSWNPNVNGDVNALSLNGSMLFAGGVFTTVGGQTRNRLVSIDTATGNATLWNPNANGIVNTLVVSGSTLYAGGNFTTIGGQTRNRLAAIDTTTGVVTSWNPNANNYVKAIALNGNMLYAGGYFTTIGGQARNYIAAIDATSGAVTTWNPTANNQVQTLFVSGSTLYAGGNFTTIGGQARNFIAALDITTGATTSWNPNSSGAINTLMVDGSTVYVGGYVWSIGGQQRCGIAGIDITTGNATYWRPDVYGTVYSIAIYGNIIYVGGWFNSVGPINWFGKMRWCLAAIDLTTGLPY